MPETMRKVYVVVQRDWSYNDEFFTGDDVPVKAFTDKEQAEEYINRCQHQAYLDRDELMGTQTDRLFTVVEMEVGAAT
jgi:hypothetical protein